MKVYYDRRLLCAKYDLIIGHRQYIVMAEMPAHMWVDIHSTVYNREPCIYTITSCRNNSGNRLHDRGTHAQ